MGFVRGEGAQVSEALGAWQGREVSFQGSELEGLSFQGSELELVF